MRALPLTLLLLLACEKRSPSENKPEPPVPAKPPGPDLPQLAIAVKNGACTVNGTVIDRMVPIAVFERELGKADRVARLDNSIYTWDKLGFGVYANDLDNVYTIAVWFKQTYPYMSKQSFAGTLDIVGTKVTAATTTAGLRAIPGAHAGFEDHTTELGNGRLEVFLVDDEKTNTIDYVEIALKYR